MNKLFANKKTRRRNVVLVITPLIIILLLCGFLALKSVKGILGTDGSDNHTENIDAYDYHLRLDATDLQKDLFKKLAKSLEASNPDDVESATLVVENFVADFYTWTNKAGQYDVGGLFYVYSPQKIQIYNQARNQFYYYLSTYIEKYGSKNLLEVTSVNAKGGKVDNIEIDGQSFDTYYVKAEWTYKDSSTFSPLGYIDKQNFLVIKNADNRFEIVEAYGDE